jgi:hypothetical protein
VKRGAPMKRSGFARKTAGPRHIADVLGEALCEIVPPRPTRWLAGAPAAPRFMPQPKTEYVRDEGYRRFVASLPCFECGIQGFSQAAHSNLAGAGKGLSIKASDEFLFPLCCSRPGVLGCHDKHDQRIGMTAEVSAQKEGTYLARMKTFTYEARAKKGALPSAS